MSVWRGLLAGWFVIAFFASWAITGLVLRIARLRGILDVPGDRSSHVVPTPRGGGLAIVLVSALGITALSITGWVPPPVAIGLVGGGLLVGMVGLLDDMRGIRPLWRGLVHLGAGSWAVAWIGGLHRIQIGAGSMELGVVGDIASILGIAWSINAYNFMDGIDGLAGTEALTVGIAGAVLLGAHHLSLGLPVIVLAGSAAGFLIWNWSPARIFMGDVGSGFLGFMFAVFAIISERQGGLSILAWSTLGMVFLVDSTMTLCRRALRGERVWEAHRSHAYQRLARAKRSHASVVIGVAGLNLGFVVLIWPPRNAGPSLLEGWLIAAVATGGWYWYVERKLAM